MSNFLTTPVKIFDTLYRFLTYRIGHKLDSVPVVLGLVDESLLHQGSEG